MEQLTIRTSIRVSFKNYTSCKICRPHGAIHPIQILKFPSPMDQLSINHPSIRASFGVYTNYKIPGPHGTSNHASMRVSMWRSAHGCGKMAYEHSRLARKVKNGKRPTRIKSAEGSLFRRFFSNKLTWSIENTVPAQ